MKFIKGILAGLAFACMILPAGVIGAEETTPTTAPTATPSTTQTFAQVFPDENLRDSVLKTVFVDGDKVATSKFDEDAAKKVDEYSQNLELSSKGIEDFTGLKLFKNVAGINVSNNKATKLDVSGMTKLTDLDCSRNDLKALTLTDAINIEKLNCDENLLTTLDISKLTKLVTLSCEHNQLTNLDISNCKELAQLSCNYNSLLSLDFSKYKGEAMETIDCARSVAVLKADDINGQYGVTLPTGAMTPIASSISNSGKYLTAVNAVVWSKLSDVPTTFTYDYLIAGTKEQKVAVTVLIDKTKLVEVALGVETPLTFTTGTSTKSGLKLSWSKVAGATGYRLYRSTSATGTFSHIKSITNQATVTYNDTTAVIGTTYYYKIRAYRLIGGNYYFGEYCGTIPVGTAMPGKTTLTLKKTNSTHVKCSWTLVSGVTGYRIYRATSKTGSYKKVKTITSGSKISWSNKIPKKKKTYYYKVRAYKTINGVKIWGKYCTIKSKKM